MDPLPIPRLRLTRHVTHQAQAMAGPSRLSPRPFVDVNSDEDEDDPVAQSTPKITPITSISPEAAPPHVHVPVETPAARLRALLSRVPNHPSSPSYNPVPISPSEVESDFDMPQSGPATPSVARESLKDIFSRALRDTPQKGRHRRNSIDISEVEASPRVEKERAKNKGKRKSLSDEEPDKPSKYSQRSETSFRSSQAAMFDSLRERLTNMNGSPPSSEHDSNDTEKLAQALKFSHSTPPAATSTPQRSVQMPSRSQFESNLLDQDSEMQRAMKSLESYEGDSGPSQHPLSFPPPRNASAHSPSPRARPSHSKSHSHDSMHTWQHNTSPRGNGDAHPRSSSRASSSHSIDKTDKELEREREWNKHHPKILHEPTHRHSHGLNSRSASPMVGQPHTLSRKGSAISLRSLDDGASTRTSSIGSQADHRERIDELERERNIEREREWNKRHPKLTRPTSSLGLHAPSFERMRAHSHATRPESAQSHVRPDHRGLLRHHSFSSSPGSSPSGSLASRESLEEQAEEVRHEIEHQLERNWNSPHPKALKPSSSHSTLSSPPHSHSHSPDPARVRAESLKVSGKQSESPNHHANLSRPSLRPTASYPSVNAKESASHDPSSKNATRQTPSRLQRSTSRPPRPNSPLPLAPSPQPYSNGVSHGSQRPGSRFGWQFPRSRTPLPPSEPDDDTSEQPGSYSRTLSLPSPNPKSPSRASGSSRISHIPVRSPANADERPSISISIATGFSARDGEVKRSHKRTTTELSDAVGSLPPHINGLVPFIPEISYDKNPVSAMFPVEGSTQASCAPTSGSDQETQPQTSTPTVGPLDTPRAAPFKLLNNGDESRLQKALAPAVITQELYPLPSPPSDSPPSPSRNTMSLLSTPQRRPSFNTTRAEFQTPSSPDGLPELPGLPSEDELGDTPLKFNGDPTALKTPRPPGAWASTPVSRHSSDSPLTRVHSLPEAYDDSQYESGLATPAASLSRATSLPPQTPAPPGGWMATPHRKSILKVRFDVEPPESEHSVSEIIGEPSVYLPGGLKDPPWGVSSTAKVSQINGDATHLPAANADPIVRTRTPEPPTTPALVPPRSPRKSPSIRVLDAFGRERSLDSSQDRSKQKESDVIDLRSKSTIRILDAMGREVEETCETSNKSVSEEDIPLKHNEALARVRKGIADLAEGLSDNDRSGDEPLDEQYLNKLDGVSQAARDTRRKISQSLQMAQDAEGDLRSKFGSLRASMRKSNFLPNVYLDRRHPWVPKTSLIFWSILVVQILLIIIMYRISVTRAKDMFLTTYYDPFYPDLHLYTMKPDTRHRSISSSVSRTSWTFLTTLDTIQQEGWRTAAADMWGDLSVIVTGWQRQVWEVWGDDRARTMSWPPT